MDVTILIITDSGCEEACAKEVGRWVKAKPKTHLNVVELKGSLDDAITLGYHLQTARRVLVQLVKPLTQIELIAEEKIDPALLEQVFPESLTFKVEADALLLRIDEPPADEEMAEEPEEGADEELLAEMAQPQVFGQQLVEEVGGYIHHLGRKVKLSKPDITVYVVSTPERVYTGIDVIGKSLAKRDWRIMLSRKSLKATVAAATIIYSGAKEGDVILDPLGDDGTIAIEAALLMSGTSPLLFGRNFGFEKFPAFAGRDWKQWKAEQDRREEVQKITAYGVNMRELKAIRTNAKLAGVEKEIHATKVEMEWVETKFEENGIDRIITQPIASGKSLAESQVRKLNDELFYQAEYVLRKNRTMTCITEKPDELLSAAQKYGFSEVERRDVLMGKRRMTIITFKNNKRKEP